MAFFQVLMSHVLRFIRICDLFSDTLSYVCVFFVFVLSCISISFTLGRSPIEGILPNICKHPETGKGLRGEGEREWGTHYCHCSVKSWFLKLRITKLKKYFELFLCFKSLNGTRFFLKR
jgi:hypothetical protein